MLSNQRLIGFGTSQSSLSTTLPSALSGLVGWWDAQDTGTITEVGNDISQWDDKSGNALHFVQATGASQPLLVASGINSEQAVRFYDDGTLKYMTATDAAAMDYTAFDIFAVVQRSGDQGTNETFFTKWRPGSNRREFHGYFSATDYATLQTSTDGTSTALVTAQAVSAVALSTAVVVEMGWDGATLYVRVNNSTQDTAAASAVYNGTGEMSIGANSDGSQPMNGLVGEIVMYNRYLASSERGAIYSYLVSKWSI